MEVMRCQQGRAVLVRDLKDTKATELPGKFERLMGYPLPDRYARTDNYGKAPANLRARLLARSKIMQKFKELEPFLERFQLPKNKDGVPLPLQQSGHSPLCTHPLCRQSLSPAWHSGEAGWNLYDKENYGDKKTGSLIYEDPDGHQETLFHARIPRRVGQKRFTSVSEDLADKLDEHFFLPAFG